MTSRMASPQEVSAVGQTDLRGSEQADREMSGLRPPPSRTKRTMQKKSSWAVSLCPHFHAVGYGHFWTVLMVIQCLSYTTGHSNTGPLEPLWLWGMGSGPDGGMAQFLYWLYNPQQLQQLILSTNKLTVIFHNANPKETYVCYMYSYPKINQKEWHWPPNICLEKV